jgi:hypothetical protein
MVQKTTTGQNGQSRWLFYDQYFWIVIDCLNREWNVRFMPRRAAVGQPLPSFQACLASDSGSIQQNLPIGNSLFPLTGAGMAIVLAIEIQNSTVLENGGNAIAIRPALIQLASSTHPKPANISSRIAVLIHPAF